MSSLVVDRFEVFLEQVLDIKQNELDDQMPLLQFPLWDSMSQLVIAAWMHQETGQTVGIEEFKAAVTIGDLKAIYVSRL